MQTQPKLSTFAVLVQLGNRVAEAPKFSVMAPPSQKQHRVLGVRLAWPLWLEHMGHAALFCPRCEIDRLQGMSRLLLVRNLKSGAFECSTSGPQHGNMHRKSVATSPPKADPHHVPMVEPRRKGTRDFVGMSTVLGTTIFQCLSTPESAYQ